MSLPQSRIQFINSKKDELYKYKEAWDDWQLPRGDPNSQLLARKELERIDTLLQMYDLELAGGVKVDDGKVEEVVRVADEYNIRKRAIAGNNRRWLLGLLSLTAIGLVIFFLFVRAASPGVDYSAYLEYTGKGDSLLRIKDMNAARAAYKKGIQYNPGDPALTRKLLLFDSADQQIKSGNVQQAQLFFQQVLSIPASPGLSGYALKQEGIASNPPLQLTLAWNGDSLVITVSGGVPFSNEKKPYTIQGVNCSNCISWKKTGNVYVAMITRVQITVTLIKLKDRLGQFVTGSTPKPGEEPLQSTAIPAAKEAPAPPPGVSKEEAFAGYVRKGDSLFSKEEYESAKQYFTAASGIRPADLSVKKKITECDARIAEKALALIKKIPRVKVGGSTFSMGTDNGNPYDGPAHSVEVGAFFISKTEITVAQYRNYCTAAKKEMPPMPSYGWNDNMPITNITWQEALEYCEWVGGRLPTEAEWECAARAGSGTLYSGSNQPGNVAVYGGNSGGRPAAAGSKAPNALGIFDMTGNVFEWCHDWYGAEYYSSSGGINPAGPGSGVEKVIRGGSYSSVLNSTHDGNQLRITYRNSEKPATRRPYIGFRVAWNK